MAQNLVRCFPSHSLSPAYVVGNSRGSQANALITAQQLGQRAGVPGIIQCVKETRFEGVPCALYWRTGFERKRTSVVGARHLLLVDKGFFQWIEEGSLGIILGQN